MWVPMDDRPAADVDRLREEITEAARKRVERDFGDWVSEAIFESDERVLVDLQDAWRREDEHEAGKVLLAAINTYAFECMARLW